MFYTRITYWDDTPADLEIYDTRDDAAMAYQSAIQLYSDAGRAHFGDCARISYGRKTGEKLQALAATNFD